MFLVISFLEIKGQGKAGSYGFTVNVASKGLAKINDATKYQFLLEANNFTPSEAGTGG